MMAGTLRVRRSRGALSGVLLVLLGIWGALIPFVGPYFHYAYTPDRAWAATSGRMWLEVLPGVVTLIGGVIVLASRFRPAAVFGAWLAALAGTWFAVGDVMAGRWAGPADRRHAVRRDDQRCAGADRLLHRPRRRDRVRGSAGPWQVHGRGREGRRRC